MFFYEGYSCPVCGKPFTESDDVVGCPVCGAPHHRACWQQTGHCHFEEHHGTPQQWSRDTAQKAAPKAETACPNCGYRNPEFAEFCAHCGKELTEEPDSYDAPPPAPHQMPYREYSPFHTGAATWEAADPAEKIGTVSSGDLSAAVGSGIAYYMPRFRRMAKEETVVSWNWAAFLLGPYWLFFRKQYGLGAVYLGLQLILSVLASFINYTVFFPLFGSGLPTPEMQLQLMQKIESGELFGPALAAMLISLVMILSHVFLGLFGNRAYYRTCVNRVHRFRERNPDGYPAELAAIGGTSLALGLTAYISLEFIGSVIVSLLLR